MNIIVGFFNVVNSSVDGLIFLMITINFIEVFAFYITIPSGYVHLPPKN